MIKPDTILASVAFIFFVITNLVVFLWLLKNRAKLSFVFCSVITINFILWTIHGYAVNDIALMSGSGFGLLTSLIILGTTTYNKMKAE